MNGLIVPLMAALCLLVCAVVALVDDGPSSPLPEFEDVDR